MEKRIFLAVLISIAVLALWSAVVPKLFPELARRPEPVKTAEKTTAAPARAGTTTPEPAATTGTVPRPPEPAATAVAAPVPVSAARVERTVIETPEYRAVLSNRGAELISFRLNTYLRKHAPGDVDLVKLREPGRTDYPFAIEARDGALAARLNSALWTVSESTEGSKRLIRYRYSDGTVEATKTFGFTSGQPYLFEFSTSISPAVPYRVVIGPGIQTLAPEEQDSRVIITGNGVVQQGGKFHVLRREKGPAVQVFPSVDYIGIEDNYFLTTLRPARGAEAVLRRVAFFDGKKNRRDDLYVSLNASGGTVSGDAFFGPKETKILDRYGLGEALQFGWFGVIARFFLEALVWINRATQNYGWAIIVLTIVIKIVLYPLQHKSIVSMKKMQKVQPKVEAIKARFKKARTDPEQRQKMNVEMMQLYQKEGINPMAGCLPLVLQLPILWGFYNLLSRAIELRGAPFMLWIQDLSEKDPYYITPILMTATMFIQTWITPATGDPAQRRIFLIMPLVFGFMFKDFPSGLVLYWLVQNILTIAQQMIMNKWWKEHPSDIQNA
jgi:YidC/Oxa1 family membrane protein insertase